MGLLDKVMFWKKDDLDFNLDKDLGGGIGDFADPTANPLDKPMAQGLPDVSNYPGVQDTQARDQMNQTLSQQAFTPQSNFTSMPPTESYHEAPPAQAPMGSSGELQILSAKLDAIKATIDALNQRMINLENMMYSNRKRDQW